MGELKKDLFEMEDMVDGMIAHRKKMVTKKYWENRHKTNPAPDEFTFSEAQYSEGADPREAKKPKKDEHKWRTNEKMSPKEKRKKWEAW